MKGDALWIASAEGHREILASLLSKAKGDDRLKKSFVPALRSAVLGGHLETIKLLLDAGADVNNQDEGGQTPLVLASLRGLEGFWEMTKKQKFPQRPGRTASDWPKVVETLLKAGADPNVQSREGFSGLMMAAAQGQKDICELLVSGGADVNLKENKGATALDIAKAGGHSPIAELLRSAGASESGAGRKDKPGATPA